MLRDRIDAAAGRRPFDVLIQNVRVVNCFDRSAREGCIGIADGVIAYAGPGGDFPALRTVDGDGCWALPGFVDAHMHLESSMVTPSRFARAALACGTTTVAADPHEIVNVLGPEGARFLLDDAEGVPLRIVMAAPSTVPSKPGLEGSGCDVRGEDMRRMLESGLFSGMGEMMDFLGASRADPRTVGILEEAQRAGCLMDGHASILTGRDLMAFRAAGIDSDHTARTGDKVREELSLGFWVQLQEATLSEDTVRAAAQAPVKDRICLVTDDVPLPRLMRKGHLNRVYALAVEMGLEPMDAVRFTTINPATRLRLYGVGGIAPGMAADLQLVRDIRRPAPERVFFAGREVFAGGKCLFDPRPRGKAAPAPLNVDVRMEDFRIPAPEGASSVRVNTVCQDGRTSRTVRGSAVLPAKGGAADAKGFVKMAVFNRYGARRHGLGLVTGMPRMDGAVALTYGHDCHNLSVYGTRDSDMLLAAETVKAAGGGLCAVSKGSVLSLVPLPIAGLMSPKECGELCGEIESFLLCCRKIGMEHSDILTFLTLMPLAASPEIKITDKGIIDVTRGCLIPLTDEAERSERS